MSMEMGEKMPPKVFIWPLCGLAVTLTFDLLTLQSNYFIFVTNCTGKGGFKWQCGATWNIF